jgi:hypothetical protein
LEDLTTAVPPCTPYTGPGGGTYFNGSDGAGGFTSGGLNFRNSFTDWGGGWTSWDGWSYSSTTDTTTAGFTNQYSAYADGAHSGANYGVFFEPSTPLATINGIASGGLTGAYFTNTTYAALSMLNGDSYAKKFGGASGNDADFFKLAITGYDPLDTVTGTVDFYLADYRFTDNAQDYIIDDWTWVDLSSLGGATKLAFDLSSSDNGAWGMNTPAYFAMDDLQLSSVPEPSTLMLTLVAGASAAGVSFRRRRTQRDQCDSTVSQKA